MILFNAESNKPKPPDKLDSYRLFSKNGKADQNTPFLLLADVKIEYTLALQAKHAIFCKSRLDNRFV